MHALLARSEEMLTAALKAAEQGDDALHEALEAIAAPIYMTDAAGVVTFFNTACIGFAGRRPAVGKDRWCVTWKLYTETGEPLPHDKCPMAAALRSGRPVRGVTAIAERPDGTRVTFTPFPTPILDGGGALVGAVNLLLDITELRQIAELQVQAQRCRRLAAGAGDTLTIETLSAMAAEYEAKAADLEAALSRLAHDRASTTLKAATIQSSPPCGALPRP